MAQEVWTLERCIQYGQQNSLNVKGALIAQENAQLNVRQSEWARYPTLNGAVNAGYNFGRSIDPTSNTFEVNTIGFNSMSLSGGVLLYNGNRLQQTIRQNRYAEAAAQASTAQTRNDAALQIAAAYLQVLMAEDQAGIAERRLATTTEQLKQLERLIQVGTRPANDRLELEAQIAADEQQIIATQNQVALSYLSLKQLMMLPPTQNIKVARPDVAVPIDLNLDTYTLSDVFNQAVTTQPQVQAADWQLKSAEAGIDIAKTGRMPSVNLFGDISTNYSTLAKRLAGIETQQVQQTVTLNGQPLVLSFDQQVPKFENNPYFGQLDQNLSQAVGVAVNIPIYNNGRTKIAIQQAQLNVENQQLQNERVRQTLKNDIQRAITDAKAAQKSYLAAEKTLQARKVALENLNKRFALGATNLFEMTSAQNTLAIANNNLIMAKYDYLFKLKILDFYMGKKISL